jgi:hypothetical protein
MSPPRLNRSGKLDRMRSSDGGDLAARKSGGNVILRVRQPAFWIAAIVASSLVSTGCQIGPGRLKVANSHYSDAVRVAMAEQLLVNLVRMRYRDGSTFLAVTNISTQFEFNTALNVNGNVVAQGGADSVGIGGGVSYSEKPTISFSIMGGETFQKRILSPLSVAAVSLLAESGWRGDRVLRLTAEGINGLQNAPTASGPTPSTEPDYEGFLEATRLLRKLRIAGLLDFAYETRRENLSAPLSLAQINGDHTIEAVKAGVQFEIVEDERVQLYVEKRMLVMRFSRESGASAEVGRLRDLLHLEPGRLRYDVVELEESDYDPLEPEKRLTEVGIDTRSLVGVLYYLSNGVQVPPEDLESGAVTTTLDAGQNPFDWSILLGGLFEVRTSDSLRRPSEAAFAVRHRGRWFYIADGDQTTKTTFLLLGSLFTLQAGDVEEMKPVLTLPVGG